MKLGKILDLNNFYYKDGHWQHPDLKEKQEYIIKCSNSPWLLGDFTHWGKPFASFWQFNPNYGCTKIQLSVGKNPKDEKWLHIQEFIGDEE